MPAKSKEQQRLFGMVHAYQKGELKDPSKEVKDIANDISYKDAKDFAETKHKGLPNKVKEKKNESKNVMKISENTLKQIVTESVKKILKEGMVASNPMFNKWFEAKELLGAEQMLDAIWNYLDVSQIESIIEGLDRDYELWNDDFEEEKP